MMSFKRYFLPVFVFMVSVSASAQTRMTRGEYIQKYSQLALENQETHGIPASITMAQALLESDCGNSRLAVLANNHFGIKCKKDWTGQTILHDDDAKGECFRKYPSVEASFRDHCDFLDKSPRYAALFELDPLDYKGWAQGLQKAGYATNPKYAEMLIKIIEENELYVLDEMDAGLVDMAQITVPVVEEEQKPTKPVEKIDVDNYVVTVAGNGEYASYVNNGSMFVVAKAGDTYKSMSAKLKVSERKLRKFNDVGPDHEPLEGEAVYVKAKANRSLNGRLLHTVTEGETMHSISQKYGIKLRKLLKINRRPADALLMPGSQIRLM